MLLLLLVFRASRQVCYRFFNFFSHSAARFILASVPSLISFSNCGCIWPCEVVVPAKIALVNGNGAVVRPNRQLHVGFNQCIDGQCLMEVDSFSTWACSLHSSKY
jgi:hypothetical protein